MPMRSMPCLEGRPHKWEPEPAAQWQQSFRRCTVCDQEAEQLRRYCGPFACWDFDASRSLDDVVDERWVTDWPGYPEWKEGDRGLTNRLASDKGGCAFCVEAHRRKDQARDRDGMRRMEEYRYWDRLARDQEAREQRWKEREQQWELARQRRTEAQRQRQLLREGHRTLTAIRRHLRGQAPLPPPESRPERTSPTS